MSSSERDVQTKNDKEHPIFSTFHVSIEMRDNPCSKIENTTVPIAQISSVTFESSKVNPQVDKLKGNFDPKVFTCLEKSSYEFSDPARLGELKYEVIGEKIHGLIESNEV
ncbi:hypothetical protein RND71_030649 [Anisodus tanguticus]|uniref:Uncharacterized protein n=1 Tax=Anisodus tanguticus TaxID=243964 RepID=A0AAE1RHU9_9SOLA|nr:hypothetical protein RND71_030649 [Anisodus tanguticus]